MNKILHAYPAHDYSDYNTLSYYGHIVSTRNLDKCIKELNTNIKSIGPKELCDIEYNVESGSKHYQKKVFSHIEEIQDQYDIIHYHLGAWNSLNYFNKIKKPLVITVHTSPALSMGVSYYSKKEFMELIDTQDAMFVFPTEVSRVSFLEDVNYPQAESKSKTILHGINILEDSEINTLTKVNRIRDYISVGRLDEIKNFHLASNLLTDKLTVVGGLNLKSKFFLDYWTSCFDSNCTEYLPPLDQKTLYIKYAYYNSYISLCKIESFGFTALEASSVGTPMIVPNSGGLGEISKSLGLPNITTSFRSKSKLKKEIEDIHEYNKKYSVEDRLKLSEVVKSKFSIINEASNYLELYTQILGKS